MSSFAEFHANGEAKYTITGPNCQILTITLDAGEKIECESGTMMFMSDFINSGMSCAGCRSFLSGEGCMRSVYSNESEKREQGYVALTPNYPSKIIPVDLSKIGGVLTAQAGSWMAHYNDVSVSSDCHCGLQCCCGGMGFVTQELKGKGMAFLNAGGTILTRELQANESILVDTQSVVAYSNKVKTSLATTGGCLSCCCGGEGMFNTKLTGPGTVYLQSMPFQKYKLSVAPPMGIPNDNQGEVA
jgi:uncharacterized protein (AIM24 family)